MDLNLEKIAHDVANDIGQYSEKIAMPEWLLTAWANSLERAGWKREVAGDADFDATCYALARIAYHSDLQPGLFIYGQAGCGKTSLCKAISSFSYRKPVFVELSSPVCAELLDERVWPTWNAETLERSVILDDLGSESPVSDFGIRRELASEFIVRYHSRGQRRLFVTTNLTGQQMLDRYGPRICSRIKELTLPLNLAGGDKRKWGAKAPVERRFAAVEGCAVASLPVEGEESSTPNSQPSTLNPQPSTRALREGGAK